ncbi:methylation-associated defense system protein kinase MAD6 [Pirellulaceae bacterium SH467]
MAKVIPIGDPVNDAERRAIAHLRDNLPDTFLILHNFEIKRGDQSLEIDIAIVAPHAVFLVDAKGTRGTMEVIGTKWYPEGREPFTSPLLKLRSHARSMKGLITDSHPGRNDLGGIFVDAVILLTSDDAVLNDPSGRDFMDVVSLKKSAAFFQAMERVPSRFNPRISTFQSIILKAIQGVAKKRTGPLRFGNWEVAERLGASELFTEYRAFNIFTGPKAGHVRLRVYQADPYLPSEQRIAQRKRIGNAYEALNRMPPHPNIIGARDFFPTESEDGYVLVTEDVPGQALRLHLDKPSLALTLDQKLHAAKGLLSALEHAHRYGVIHRNMSPSCVLLSADGHLRLTGFDFARSGTDRTHTIASSIVDEIDEDYMAPEVNREPQAASPSSDVFSAGLILYETFTGDRPFKDQSEIFSQSGVFPQKPSSLRSELSTGYDNWLQRLCSFDPDKRPSAKWALERLIELASPSTLTEPKPKSVSSASVSLPKIPPVDYSKLESGMQLTSKYVIEKRLGRPGSFGVVYKAIDTLGDVPRAIKLILRDRHSTIDRLKKEYRTLLRTPEHPNVVRVFDADLLPGNGPPFIVFEYVNGFDVGEMIEGGVLSPEDTLDLARQVVAGLVHLHQHEVYHCDIKPRNLLWTDKGVKIIDFNVSVIAESDEGHGGGSRRYLPPDLDLSVDPTITELADRDIYALGITLYEALTGRYPWETTVPPPGIPATDPREVNGPNDLTPEFVAVLLKAISPQRSDRFASAVELRDALSTLKQARRIVPPAKDASTTWAEAGLGDGGVIPANTNPFVNYLLTLYSQSQYSNSGTRGLDSLGQKIYVDSALDRELTPTIFAGELGLVLITGNAGDGKTAYLQKLEGHAKSRGAIFDPPLLNGYRFAMDGRTFLSNFDGSQDEGERQNDDVLREFFGPYAGKNPAKWPKNEIRLIAINEGRLVDFLSAEGSNFSMLTEIVLKGLKTGVPEHRVGVVNLNLRSVVAGSLATDGSLLERLLRRMTNKKFWKPCQNCDLKDRCYAHHNALTIQDETAGPKVIERLHALYTLTHLRGRLHITLRDLRSALAYMLAGIRSCAEIHTLYQTGQREEIIQGFYFNSWMGGDEPNADRLLTLLKDVDVGPAVDPRLDRALDFVSPTEDRSLFSFAQRGTYDEEILRRSFDELPREIANKSGKFRAEAHQKYVALLRRRSFFERRDSSWKAMLPYRSAEQLLTIIANRSVTSGAAGDVREHLSSYRLAEKHAASSYEGDLPADLLGEIISGINRGEGLSNPRILQGSLALKVRDVENGSIRSYRVFQSERFSLQLLDDAARARFVEHLPSGLVLKYEGDNQSDAELVINLDIFEMLQRLNAGYRPSVEEEQGYYLSLAVFKNILGSAPYQDVLLTTTGHDFFQVKRLLDGRLEMSRAKMEVGNADF